MSFCFLGRPAHVHYPINMYEHLYSAFKLVEKSDTKKKKKKLLCIWVLVGCCSQCPVIIMCGVKGFKLSNGSALFE